MRIHVVEKPKQTPRELGKNANQWPRDSGTIWRVVESDHEDFLVDDRLLYMSSDYSGHAWINLRTEVIFTGNISTSYDKKVMIVQDFTVNQVSLFVDNSARP